MAFSEGKLKSSYLLCCISYISKKLGLLIFFLCIVLVALILGLYIIIATDNRIVSFKWTRIQNHGSDLLKNFNGKSHMTQGDIKLELLEYYKQMGAEIISTKKSEIFNALFTKSYIQHTHLSTGSLLGRISLEYSPFNFSLPKFISEEDRQIFYLSKENVKELQAAGKSELFGDIGFLFTAIVDQKIDCGWRNSLQDYFFAKNNSKNLNKDNKSSFKTRWSVANPSHVVVPLLVPNGASFQHFIDGVLPKLAQISPFLSDPSVTFLLDYPFDSIVPEMLEEVGVHSSRISHYKYPTILQGYQLNTCITPPVHPGLWGKMRQMMDVNRHIQVPLINSSIILLTRLGSRNGGRNIINQQEVTSYLQNRYGNRLFVFKGGYNLKQSKEIFSKAGLVIGVHGGAFYNINFCPQETIVAEYLPLTKDRPFFTGLSIHIVWKMADMNKQRYYRITENPLQDRRDDINITMPKLKNLLDEVDRIQLG